MTRVVSAEYCNGRIEVSVEWRSRYNDGGAWTFLSVHRNKVETLSGIKRNSACYPTQVIFTPNVAKYLPRSRSSNCGKFRPA